MRRGLPKASTPRGSGGPPQGATAQLIAAEGDRVDLSVGLDARRSSVDRFFALPRVCDGGLMDTRAPVDGDPAVPGHRAP